jgi:sec-independent protein translocase protein TatB
MNLGMPEMLLIFLLALMVFGPRKLPEIGKQMGKFMSEIKRTSEDFKQKLESEVKQIDQVEQKQKFVPTGTSADLPVEGNLISPDIPPALEAPDNVAECTTNQDNDEITAPVGDVLPSSAPDTDRLGIFRSSVSIDYLAAAAVKVDPSEPSEQQIASSNA